MPGHGNDGAEKRSTAIGHLVEMANIASERIRLRDTNVGWPWRSCGSPGDLLELAETVETGTVVLVLDVTTDERTRDHL